jgi:2-dehydro-3-deoxygluconokinase
MPHEVVTFGEAMIRLSPPNFRRLEQARSLDVQVGGAELNTAVGVARLGRSAAWVSRLTDNPLGRLIANHAREAGVGTEHVVWTNDDRVGVYFLEFGAAPRASSVLYDRKGAAIAAIRPGMVPWATVFAGARWFHVSGITTEEDTERVFGITGKGYEDVAAQTAKRFPVKIVAITLRENPLVWKNSWTAIAYQNGAVRKTRSYEVEIVDRLGAGDSFAAGLIHGLLDDDLQKGLDFGVAASALKHSIPGDFNWVTREEVETVLKTGGLRISR